MIFAFFQSLELGVLSEKRMGKALKEFVEKEEKDAIKELVKWELGKIQSDLFRRNAGEDDIPHLLEEKKKNTDVNEEEESEEIERVLICIFLCFLEHPHAVVVIE